jgi:hypothetical protein
MKVGPRAERLPSPGKDQLPAKKAADKMLTMNPEAGRTAPLESGTLPRFENRYAAQT